MSDNRALEATTLLRLLSTVSKRGNHLAEIFFLTHTTHVNPTNLIETSQHTESVVPLHENKPLTVLVTPPVGFSKDLLTHPPTIKKIFT
jgi:hypothetical protein